jgi:hypothetical protein
MLHFQDIRVYSQLCKIKLLLEKFTPYNQILIFKDYLCSVPAKKPAPPSTLCAEVSKVVGVSIIVIFICFLKLSMDADKQANCLPGQLLKTTIRLRCRPIGILNGPGETEPCKKSRARLLLRLPPLSYEIE